MIIWIFNVFLSRYPKILEALFFLLKREEEARNIDNICAAVCRMIFTNISMIPMEQVL